MALRVTGVLGLDGSGFFGTINRAQTAVGRFAGSARGVIASRMAGLFSVGALGMAFRKTTEYAGQLVDMAERTGVAVETLQKLDKAAKENGTSMETLVGFWDRLNAARGKAINDPKGADAKAFQRFGISGQDLASKSAEDLTRKIALSFQSGKNIQQLTADLQELGGKGVGQLVGMFKAGLDKMNADMTVMTTEQAILLDDLDDRFSTLWQSIVVNLAPGIVTLIGWFNNLWLALRVMMQGLAGMIQGVTSGFAAFLDQLKKGDFKGAFKAFVAEMATAKQAADEEIENIMDEEVKSRAAADEARRKKAEAMRNKKDQKYTGTPEADAKGKSKTPDSLAEVGNFLGSSQNSIVAVNNKILEVHRLVLKEVKLLNNNVKKNGLGGWPQ